MQVDLVRKSERPVQMRSEVSQSNDLSIKKQLFYQFYYATQRKSQKC